MRSSARRAAARRGKKITVVGLGNTGSHHVPLLADIPDLAHVQLVDGGVYEAGNLGCQAILPRDVGRPKALVQARRLRQLNAALRVDAYVQWLEHVPWGNLRGDVIVSCVDSRVARQWINEIAWRQGVVWFDLAVDAAHLLARVNVYAPGADAPCLECAWNDEDYAALEQVYACGPEHATSAPTRAPSSLGAVPAALAATELRKLLGGESEGLLTGRQVLCDLRHHEYWVTRYERNPACRFDHQSWAVTPFPSAVGRMTWRRFLQSACPKDSLDAVACRVAGQSFTRLLAPVPIAVWPLCTTQCWSNVYLPASRSALRAASRCAVPASTRRTGYPQGNSAPAEKWRPGLPTPECGRATSSASNRRAASAISS